jgi:hypothetical protein
MLLELADKTSIQDNAGAGRRFSANYFDFPACVQPGEVVCKVQTGWAIPHYNTASPAHRRTPNGGRKRHDVATEPASGHDGWVPLKSRIPGYRAGMK